VFKQLLDNPKPAREVEEKIRITAWEKRDPAHIQ
jgi:hypothetical protein